MAKAAAKPAAPADAKPKAPKPAEPKAEATEQTPETAPATTEAAE